MGSLLFGLSSKCLEKLAVLLEEEVVRTLSVRTDLAKLRKSLEGFGSVKEDFDARAVEDSLTGKWWRSMKDVMYDVDDITDLLSAHLHKEPCCDLCIFSRLSQIPFDSMIARRIKSINERLVEITKNRDMFTSPGSNPQTTQKKDDGTGYGYISVSVDEIYVVGTDIMQATDNMVEMIVGNGHQNGIESVYGILGMGGIGKTTLAQKIYNHRMIRGRFHQVLIWLSISESISGPDLLKEALQKAGGGSGDQLKSKDQLVRALMDCIAGKSVFLVLDNVISSDVWTDLLRCPMERASDVHVLVTTRSRDVLSKMNAVHVQEVRKLNESDGLELLMKKSFRTKDVWHIFSDIGAEIVKKCDGLPLAIKVIAGVLSNKPSREDWVTVLEKRWYIEGLPDGLQGSLYLSYGDLSPQLKQCFLWCALLPQNYDIHRDVTYWWIAEGFVKKEGDRPVHDTAEDYYYELIRRNLLHAKPEYVDKGIATMHDVLRSLGQYLTRDEAVFMNKETQIPSKTIRRLAVGNAVQEIPCLENKKKLRCLLVFNHTTCKSVKRDIYKKLEHLRILVLVGAGLDSVPWSVGQLVLLRLLDVSYNEIKELPESIGNLSCLECLSVFGCAKLLRLPASLGKLTLLSFLQIGNTGLTQVRDWEFQKHGQP